MSLRYINSNSVFALTSVETVTFDVGGQLHRITLAFLGMHQNVGCFRAAMSGYNPFDTSPIFIDRDGDLFRHVIQYLRCGEIDLPITVPMATFLRELKHYDICPRPGFVRQQRISLGEFDLFVCTCTLVTGLIAVTCQALRRNIKAY